MIARRLNTQPLEVRRRELGISKPLLAQRSDTSVATVNRLLSGDFHNATLSTICAVADALGMNFKYQDGVLQFFPNNQTSLDLRRAQARAKAERLAKLTQGTSALEGQAVAETGLREAIEQTTAELLAGSPGRLWA